MSRLHDLAHALAIRGSGLNQFVVFGVKYVLLIGSPSTTLLRAMC
jgi:hypothetical protein